MHGVLYFDSFLQMIFGYVYYITAKGILQGVKI